MKKILPIVMISLIVLSTSSMLAPKTKADSTVIAVDPSLVNVDVGEEFTVSVNITDVTDLYSWQIVLIYDNTTLNYTDVWYPDDYVFADKTSMVITPMTIGINETWKLVLVGGTLLGAGPGFNGSGILCNVNFTGAELSTCTLKVGGEGELIAGKQTKLLDSVMNEMPFTTQNGRVTVTGVVTVEVGNATLRSGGREQVPLMVRNVENLGAYDFNVTFDPEIVNVTGVVGGESPFTSPVYNVNPAGYVCINQFISGTTGPSGEVTVAYLNVTAVGDPGDSSKLEMEVISLVDAETGEEIEPRTAVDGNVWIVWFEVTVSLNVDIDPEDYVVVDVRLNSSADLGGGLGAYTLNLTASDGIVASSTLGGEPPFDAPPTVNTVDGQVILTGFISETSGPQMSGLLVARLRLRLDGAAGVNCTVEPDSLTVVDAASGEGYPATVDGEILSFVRGDANNDNQVSISDSMFIAQYLAGNRPQSDLNLLNTASIKQDGEDGDQVSIADAMFIAQHLAGLRDEHFNPE